MVGVEQLGEVRMVSVANLGCATAGMFDYKGYTGQLACIRLQINISIRLGKALCYFVMGILTSSLPNDRLFYGFPELL
jgi:hypothetical protein